MLPLLYSGQYGTFLAILFVLIFSLTCHEFGHAYSAKLLGDNTAERMGRVNLNPLNHIDPIGLLAVILIGFGYAKPVPITPRNIKQPWGGAAVAAAGPFMNLVIAIIAANLLSAAFVYNIDALASQAAQSILFYVCFINLILMLFNLVPLGPLDGHYIMEWLLPRNLKYKYHQFNDKYGSGLFIGLILLSFIGLPIFSFLRSFSSALIPYITFI